MNATLIDVDPTSPKPPFPIGGVSIVRGLVEMAQAQISRERLIVCVAGSAKVLLEGASSQTFDLVKPGEALLVDQGVALASVGGPDNISTIIFTAE